MIYQHRYLVAHGRRIMDKIYIEIEIKSKNNERSVYTNVECFLALYVYKCLQSPKKIEVCYVNKSLNGNESGKILLNNIILNEVIDSCIINKEFSEIVAIRDLRLPIYQKDENTFIAGICAVSREIVQSEPSKHKLLGFKNSSLLAPAEASIWTRYCEVDIVRTLKDLLLRSEKNEITKEIPLEISRFEKHLSQPVRIHNIYKLAREIAIKGQKNITKEDIEHRFAEGVDFTIADLLLYPCMRLIFEHFSNIEENFPLISAWLQEIDSEESLCRKILNELRTPSTIRKAGGTLHILDCESYSLYKSDPKRYKPKNRIFTEQSKIDVGLNKLHKHFEVYEFRSDFPNNFEEANIDWNTIEPGHEKNSALPEQRLVRKRQQLESMANAIAALATPGDRIIDFCSGTGHLGILLALQLQACTIILIENKANSLERAKKRAKDLNLSNIHFYQCNIDYFVGDFDLGTSLHACGTATDIVLQQCRRSRAKFVCCPCCYGSLCSMDHIRYPQSKRFREVLSTQDFMCIGHAADQAHELGTTNCRPEISTQGQYCMDIVDTDRKYYIEEAGYKVILTRLKPEKCTPKNHLLVGWCDEQFS